MRESLRIRFDSRPRQASDQYGYPIKRLVLLAALAAVPWVCSPPAGAELSGFTSPSANIGCIMDHDWVRCDILERDWSPPPRPADCPSVTGYGQGIELHASGLPEFVCAGDTTLNSGPPLAYGRTHSAEGQACDSTPAGITCTNRDNHGFTISREAYRLF